MTRNGSVGWKAQEYTGPVWWTNSATMVTFTDPAETRKSPSSGHSKLIIARTKEMYTGLTSDSTKWRGRACS